MYYNFVAAKALSLSSSWSLPSPSPSLLEKSFKMTPEQRAWLREQIIVVMRRDPNTTLKQMKAYVREDPTVDWATVNNKTFHNYLDRNMAKYRDKGSLKRKPGTGGNGQISLRKVQQLGRLTLNKRNMGAKKASKVLGIGETTVRRYLKKRGAKPYHRVRVQKLTPEHKAARVR